MLKFSHHVLFDYAAARLLLRGETSELVRHIERQPDLTLILQPSFALHFHHLWGESKSAFWLFAFQLVQSPGVPQIGKLIGPAAAAELANTLEDFDPLLSAMTDTGPEKCLLADQIFEHVVGSLVVASQLSSCWAKGRALDRVGGVRKPSSSPLACLLLAFTHSGVLRISF